MHVAYLGPRGSFTHHVAVQAFPQAELKPFPTITDVIKAYEDGDVDYAVMPIENSIEGTVHETIDYLYHQAQIHVLAEVVHPIAQQLMAVDGQREIKKIFSHPQAIAQGKRYIKTHFPKAEIEMTASTAYAARHVAKNPDKSYAAIAPQAAAKEYGLTIIAQDIQEIKENFTRFWIVGQERPELALPLQSAKASLALTLPDNHPGALYKAMSVFAWREIDLTKIESRPLKTALGEYFFILDVDHTAPEKLEYALKELTSLSISYKILGDYLVYQTK